MAPGSAAGARTGGAKAASAPKPLLSPGAQQAVDYALTAARVAVWVGAVPLVLYLGMKSKNPSPQWRDLFRFV